MKGVINQIALIVFAVLAIATLLLAVFNDHGLLKVHAQAQKLSSIADDVVKIQAENKALADEIHALRTDPTTIEKLAREELRLVKPGEVVLVTPAEHDH
jgi:cell division protein FtsB